MSSLNVVSADLLFALAGTKALSQDLYSDVLADFEGELKASRDNDADDALLCMLADEGDVAMLLIDWDGRVHRNDEALLKLRAMWKGSFDANARIWLMCSASTSARTVWVWLASNGRSRLRGRHEINLLMRDFGVPPSGQSRLFDPVWGLLD